MISPRPALLALPLLALAACGSDIIPRLGFTRDAPDEFQVTTRAPLSVPPRLGDLPPPTPGAPRPQDNRAATGSVLAPGTSSAAPSASERALVARAGGPVGGDIRRAVDEESLRLDRPPTTVVDQLLMFWRADERPPGVAVDASRKSQRLRENAALGRDVGDGTTPIVQPRQPNWFRRMLGLE